MDTVKYSERIEATLGRSRHARAFVAVAAFATLGLVFALPLAPELRALAAAWTAVAALHALHRLRGGVHITLDRSGAIRVGEVEGNVREGSFVAPWLVAVRWRPMGRWTDRSLLVAPDMLGADDFRRLRVLLRWGES